MNESITIEKQDENNVIDESKPKNCALEEQVDDLKDHFQSLQKRNETLERYTTRIKLMSLKGSVK